MSVGTTVSTSTHNINIRQAHADFLRLLAEATGSELSDVTRAVIDWNLLDRQGEYPLLASLDPVPHKRALKKLLRQADNDRDWTALDITLRQDQVMALTERAQENRSSLSRMLRHVVAAYLEALCGGARPSFSATAAFDAVSSRLNFGLIFKIVGAGLLLVLLAGGGWWLYENRDQFLGGAEAQEDIVIDSLEALEELERRNREAGNRGNN